MEGPESVSPKKKPELMDAAALVDLLAHAGPGSGIKVNIHFGDGSVKQGELQWSDDRSGTTGPVIVIPNKENPYDEGILPLGGETVFNYPPKVSSGESIKGTPIMPSKDQDFRPYRKPINKDTEGVRFEVIKKGK